MKRSQVTAHITHWEGKGALYIVAHSKFQKSRGKNPSEPYRGELNPRKALLLALAELQTFEPMCVSYISTSIAQMVAVAKFTNQEVTGTFSGVTITVNPKSSPEILAVNWQEEMDRQAREYRNSAEYKSYLLKRALEVQALRVRVRDLMKRLETLDFGNLEAVVNWFDEIQEASSDVDASSELTRNEIVQKFQQHGYQPGVNTEGEFKEEDKDNFARYLVGLALNCLNSVGAVHPIYKDFAQDWRKKFIAPFAETESVS